MLQRPSKMTQLLLEGGPFLGDNKPCTRITVQPNWWLNTYMGPFRNYPAVNLPVRWWQDYTNNQTEIEIPNLKKVVTDRSLQEDAATIEVVFYNTHTPANGSAGESPDAFGDRGYYSFDHGTTPLSRALWNQQQNSWENLLRENALLREYSGYGGWLNTDGSQMSLEDAVTNGNLMLTGVYLVDTIAIEAQTGLGTLTGRDMAKLLIDQPIWPPLVPVARYSSAGLQYYHNLEVTFPGAPVYGAPGETSPIVSQPAPLEPGLYKTVYDIAVDPVGIGYWICGSDGGVFTYGEQLFYGSEGAVQINAAVVAMDSTPDGQGYWLFGADGGVYAFGDAGFFGSGFGVVATPVVSGRATSTGRGYWLVDNIGEVYSFGDAQYHGGAGSNSITAVGFTPRPQNDGYWILASTGAVYSFGNAVYHGGTTGGATGICSTSDGNGYWITTSTGTVTRYGTAPYYTSNVGAPLPGTLNAPISNIRRTADGLGYYLVGEDGGIFTFGDAGFWGSLPGPHTVTLPGNYDDYSSVIRDFCLWSGFHLRGAPDEPDGSPALFGELYETGAYDAVGPIDPSTFDKLPVIDGIKAIKQAVGWIFRVREDGSVCFKPPNWWGPGNFFSNGTPTTYIPVFTEQMMTDYIQTTSDQSLRSQIIVSPVDPYIFGNHPNLVTVTNLIPNNIQSLHGMVKPAMIGTVLNVPVTQEDQDLMAELQALQCWLASRTGQLNAVFDPAICPDDQIRILERTTGETSIHYVIGVHVEHDLDRGTCLATYTTQWMGDSSTWAVTSDFSSFYGTGAGGTITDQSFDANGNLIYNKTYAISEALLQRLAQSNAPDALRFQVATINGQPTIVGENA